MAPARTLLMHADPYASSIAAYLTREGRRVCMVFTVTDATFAAPIPYPDFVRRSRQVR